MRASDAGAPQFALQREVEVRRIDADEHIRAVGAGAGAGAGETREQAAANAENAGQFGCQAVQADDADALHVEQNFAAGRGHPRPADAAENAGRAARAQRLDEAGRQLVAGRFAGHQRHPQPGHAATVTVAATVAIARHRASPPTRVSE